MAYSDYPLSEEYAIPRGTLVFPSINAANMQVGGWVGGCGLGSPARGGASPGGQRFNFFQGLLGVGGGGLPPARAGPAGACGSPCLPQLANPWTAAAPCRL